MATWADIQRGIFSGESGGDYDALFGYQNRAGGKFEGIKVSQMPIADVLRFTSPSGAYGKYVAGARPDPEKGVATPVGAYQVVGSTLRRAVNALGIDPSQKFDKETQDKIGQWILKEQGTGAWEGYKGPRVSTREGSPMDQMQQPQQRDTLLSRLTSPRTIRDLASLSRSGFGRQLAQVAQIDLERQQALEDEQRKLGMATEQRNRTAEWLRTQPNGEKFAAAIEAGMPANQVYQAYMASAQQPETYKPMTGKQINEQFGTSLPEDKLFNISPKGQITQVGGGGVTIEGDKGVDEFAKQDAKTLSDTFTAGATAKSNLNKINRLSSLLSNVETGSMAALKSTMGNFGIETEGLGDIQAAEALINAMVPAQRPAGSGPMSDADLDLFKRSLPRLINQPYGNQIIIQTLRGIAEYDAMGADIVQQYRTGQISKSEAFQQLMNRPDPFAAQTDPSSYLPQE
jgi:hypothetical protein